MTTTYMPSSASENEGAMGSSKGEQDARSSFSKSVWAAAQGTDSFDDQLYRPTRGTLLEQFYATLRVSYFTARESAKKSEERMHVIEELDRLFADEKKTWQKAYNIELQLTQIMTLPQIETEWKRRLSEAKYLGLPYLTDLTAQYASSDKADQNESLDDPLIKRVALQRLLNDLQWFYHQRIQRRDAARLLAARVSRLFWLAFLIFVFLLFIQIWTNPVSQPNVNSSTQEQPR